MNRKILYRLAIFSIIGEILIKSWYRRAALAVIREMRDFAAVREKASAVTSDLNSFFLLVFFN